jgi:hypothetical protein
MQEWHDINEPGRVIRGSQKLTQQQKIAPVEFIADTIIAKEEPEKEVKLSCPKFLEGDEGFKFNKKCRAQVTVDYLKETFRKKVTFSLFSEYKGKIQDMHHEVIGYEESGLAEAEITLYYNDEHYSDYYYDQSIQVDYFFKATHPTAKEIESPRLTMPNPTEIDETGSLPDFDPGKKDDNLDLYDDYPIPEGENEEEMAGSLPDFDPGNKESNIPDLFDNYPIPEREQE